MASPVNRTPLEKMFAQCDRDNQKLITTANVKFVSDFIEKKGIHFAYDMSSFLREKATKAGISLNPQPFLAHSHPFCKTLENHFLLDILPSLLGNSKWIFSSIKQNKIDSFIRKANSVDNNIDLINKCICARDFGRYSVEPNLADHQVNYLSKEARFPKNYMRSFHRACIFIHDEVHHWSVNEMVDFLEFCKPKRLIFTVVYPPELLLKINESQNPEAYKFKIIGKKFHFFPDGCHSEGYEQQIDLNWLMRGAYIDTDVGTFTIKRVKSILAHHMFEIVPGRRATESTRFFSDFDTIDMSVLQLQRWKFQHHVPIRKVILKKIYDYLLCLKKPDVESAEAKLRQIIGDNEDCRISTFFLKFAKDIINRNKSTWDLYGVSLLNGFKDSMLGKLPVRIQKAFRRWGDNNLFEFLFTLDTLSVEIKTVEIKRNWFHDIIAECVDNDVMKQSLPECIDDLWFGFNLPQRRDNRLELSSNRVFLWCKERDPRRISILEKNYWDRRFEMNQDSFLKKIEGMRFKVRFNHFSTCNSWVFRMIYKLRPSGSFLQWSSAPGDHNDFNPYGIEVSDHPVVWGGHVKITLLSCSFFDDQEIKVSLFSNLCLEPEEEERANLDQIIEDSNDDSCVHEPSSELSLDHSFGPPRSNEAESLVASRDQTTEVSDRFPDTLGGLEDLIISEENKLAHLVTLDVVTSDIPAFKKKRAVGDGNCFYRSMLMSYGKDQEEHGFLKAKLMNAMRDLGVNERVVAHFEGEGIFADQIVVFAFVIANKCSLFIQEGGGLDKLLHIGLPHPRSDSEVKEIYIERNGPHFDALIPDYAKIFEKEFLMSEGADDFSKLNSFLNEVECSRVTKLRGRQAYFFTDSDADYAHNKVKYAVNHIVSVEDLLPEELRSGYNSMLIQIFSQGAEIGLHKDNERCYDDESILSVNLKGSATFLIENGDLRSIELTDGMWLRMNAGFQRRFRHGVTDCSSGRVNVTFRKHIRRMDGTPLVDTISEVFLAGKGNACLIEAIADADGQSPIKVFKTLVIKDKSWMDWIKGGFGGSMSDMIKAATQLSFSFDVFDGEKIFKFGNNGPKFNFDLLNGHWSKAVSSRHGMLETSISSELIKAGDESPLLTRIHESNVLFFTPSAEAAANLKNSFLRRTTGVLLSEVYGDNFNCLKDFEIKETNEQFRVEAICGFAGSGKSRNVQSLIKTVWRNLNFLVISPRANLKDDWIEKACCKKNWVKTFEIAMAHDFSKTDLIIIDELTLFPNGYLDLLLFKLKEKKKGKLPRILCLFDPLQARYHSDLDSSSLFEMHECDRLIKGETVKYLMQSMRLNEDFFGTFFPSIKLLGDLSKPFSAEIYPSHTVAIARSEDKDDPIDCILVASRDEKKALGCKLPVMTFGESQGLTFKRVCIVLSEYSEKQDVFRQIVALTRARESVCFACIYRGGIAMYLELNKGSVFSMFIRSEPFSARRMEICAGCSLEPIETKFGKGYDEVDREERLEGDPFIKPFICLAQRVNSEDVELIEPEVVEPKGQAHLCIAQSNFALARNFDLIRAKELREFRIDMEETNQFCHDYNRLHAKGKAETAGPLRFESIFPRHRNEDNLTFWMAVHKRLRFSDEATERAKLKEAGGIGALLYSNFKEKLGLDFVWDQNLLDECVNDFETKKLSKSKAMITNHAIRSDIDWDMNSVFLFMKNQLCTKFEKQYVDAKAGQTLACFQHLILVKFAPYCRYMEKMLRSRFGENIYIHSNKNFDDLNDWVKKFYTGEMCIESDYEAFDASQDEYILSFELHLMEDMGMPRWFINDYIDLKCTLGCKLGHFAIMRFTGEFCTFLFNTLANMAFTYARYDISRDDPIAFAGDDMCMLVKRDVKPDFEEIFEKISLKAKVMLSERPMFCGWNLSQHGIVKEPELVYNRFKIAEERGNVDECIENYAIEVSYAYSLGEKLYDVLKREEQIEYHQAVVRFIVKNLDKLKTCVKDLFADQIRI